EIADDDLEPRVAEVERLGAPLIAVADDRDRLPVEGREARIGVVVDLCHWAPFRVLDHQALYRAAPKLGYTRVVVTHKTHHEEVADRSRSDRRARRRLGRPSHVAGRRIQDARAPLR